MQVRLAGYDAFNAHQIERFGPRYVAYREALSTPAKLARTPDFPLYVMLEQTFLCNLRCPTCILGDDAQSRAFKAPSMKRDLYERIIEECGKAGLPSISMHSTDEPLIVKDLVERVALARDAGIMDIILSTNGHLITRAKAEGLIEAGVTHLLFSIDAASSQTYDKTRPGGGTFDDVIERIQLVRQVRGNRPSPTLRASFVVSRLNQHECRQFTDLFGPMVDYIDFQDYAGFEDNVGLAPANAIFADPATFTCNSPFQRVVIRGNGDVLPCCSSYGYQVSLGNLGDATIAEIWNSPQAQRMRQNFLSNRYGPVCQSCIRRTVVGYR